MKPVIGLEPVKPVIGLEPVKPVIGLEPMKPVIGLEELLMQMSDGKVTVGRCSRKDDSQLLRDCQTKTSQCLQYIISYNGNILG